jgi:hypothetical protein
MIILNEKLKETKDREIRTYSVCAIPEHLDIFETIMAHIEHLGNIGHSSSFTVGVDGDGRARFQFVRLKTSDEVGKDLDKSEKVQELLDKYVDENGDIKEIGFD